VANRDDRCPVAPPGQAPAVARALGGASSVTVRMVAGGAAGDRPCGSLGPHGYFGIEGRVETVIAGWIGALHLEKEKGGA
ncbi:MAG: alpha/beta hydrolase, partial [Rhodospirillales bacterium]|nr:alpha/beta hydrolase [Rhodospirillales bacterium]